MEKRREVRRACPPRRLEGVAVPSNLRTSELPAFTNSLKWSIIETAIACSDRYD